MWPRRGWHHGLNDQNSGVRRHIATDRGQNLGGFRVGPVVDDIHQQVGVRFGHGICEEVAAGRGELLASFRCHSRNDVRLIEENSLGLGRSLQDCPQQVATSASDVSNASKLREIIRR